MSPNNSLAREELLQAIKRERDPLVGQKFAINSAFTDKAAPWWKPPIEDGLSTTFLHNCEQVSR